MSHRLPANMLKDSCKHLTVLFVSSLQVYNFLARLLHIERLRRDSRNTQQIYHHPNATPDAEVTEDNFEAIKRFATTTAQ